MSATASFGGNQVHRSTDCVGPVERRARSAQNFESIHIRYQQILHETRSVTLRRCSIPKPEAVHQHCCVFITQASDFDVRERTRTSELLHSQPGHIAKCFRNRQLISNVNLLGVNRGDSLGYLVYRLRGTGSSHNDFIMKAGQTESNVESGGLSLGEHNLLSRRASEAGRFSLKEVPTGPQAFETVIAAAVC